MLRAALRSWLQPARSSEPAEGRTAYHSDIRAIRPDAWTTQAPVAKGVDVERAMSLAGVTTRDFEESVDIVLSPHLVTPVDDIVTLCERRSAACRERADSLTEFLPPPNAYGRPPLPWHRSALRDAKRLLRAADAWDALAQMLVSNHWPR